MHATRKLHLAIRFSENGSVQCFKLCAFPLSIIGDPSSEASEVSTAPNGCF